MLKLAHRMSQICMKNMNATTKKTWNSISSMGDVGKIFSTREHYENNLGRPDGNVTTMTTSVRLPFSAERVYGSFQCAQCRPKVRAYVSIYNIQYLNKSLRNPLCTYFTMDGPD